MSTSDPDFYEAKKFSPEPDEEPKRGRGCFFYGCLITGILSLLLAITIGITTYAAYRWFTDMVEQNTATAPRALPKVEVSPQTREAIKEKVDQFKKAADADDSTQTLVFSADELNALIEENPDLRGQVFLSIDGDRVKGKLSLSLDKISSRLFEKVGIKVLRGRYFNGEIEVKGSFSDGTMKLVVESLEVNGRRLPEPVVTQVNDMVVQFSRDPDVAKETRKIDSLVVKDGKVIITRHVNKAKTGTVPPPAPRELPDNVLAPPDAGQPAAPQAATTDTAKSSPPVSPTKKP